jgi:ribosomal protein L1
MTLNVTSVSLELSSKEEAWDARVGQIRMADLYTRLSNIPRPKMKVCVLGDAHHCDQAKQVGLEFMSVDDLKKLNKNKKLIKKLGRLRENRSFVGGAHDADLLLFSDSQKVRCFLGL